VSGADRPNVIILGGGIGALTSAYFLSEGEWRNRFQSLTIYQQGWRLGGKGASGRNAGRGNRIEEHGLHVWFGYYENAFRMLADCHRELDDLAVAGGPWRRWSDAMTDVGQGFRPISRITVIEDESETWRPWAATFAPDDTSPWDRDLETEPADWDVAWYMRRLLELAVPLLRAVARSAAGDAPHHGIVLDPGDGARRVADATRAVVNVADRAESALDLVIRAAAAAAAWFGQELGTARGEQLFAQTEVVLGAMGRALDAIRVRLGPDFDRDDALRRMACVADLLVAIFRGLIRHRVLDNDGLDALDEWDFRDWLDMHGALAESVDSSLVRCLVYDLPFAYESGDRRTAGCAAGTAIRLLFRTFFTYRGALMWKMNAGMGDVVVAPLYELLVKRGVNVEFFHQVVRLDVENARVTKVAFRRQHDHDERVVSSSPAVRLNAYKERLVEVAVPEGARMAKGGLMCWPSRPSVGPADAEQYFGQPHEADVELDVGEGDVVVFGLPLGTVPYVANQLMTDPRWKALVENVQTVATFALQLWLTVPMAQFCFQTDDIACGFSEPLDTFSDMPELRYQEDVAGDASVVYLCSVLEDLAPPPPPSAGYQDEVEWREKENGRAQVLYARFVGDRATALWPGPSDGSMMGFDLSLLVGGTDADVNGSQYL
jgi:uncharacterized protein with NAD-binding domain and iron-sulfur cluster